MISEFDAPGAGTGPGQGTFPYNSTQLINPNGASTVLLINLAVAEDATNQGTTAEQHFKEALAMFEVMGNTVPGRS